MLLDIIKQDEWYKSRPEVIKKAIEIWLPNSKMIVDNKEMYLLGYSETKESDVSGDPYDIMLILSHIDPCSSNENYWKAQETGNKTYLCAKHFKEVK